MYLCIYVFLCIYAIFNSSKLLWLRLLTWQTHWEFWWSWQTEMGILWLIFSKNALSKCSEPGQTSLHSAWRGSIFIRWVFRMRRGTSRRVQIRQNAVACKMCKVSHLLCQTHSQITSMQHIWMQTPRNSSNTGPQRHRRTGHSGSPYWIDSEDFDECA